MKIEQTRKKNAPPLGSHVFQAKVTIFELIQDIIGTNHLSKLHEDRKINVASREKLVQDIIGMNLLTKFNEDRTINVASRVKNAQPLGSHVFQANVTIFELIQDIIETNLLTKFHEDWTINANVDVAQRTTHNAQRTTDKRRSQKLTMSTLCSDNTDWKLRALSGYLSAGSRDDLFHESIGIATHQEESTGTPASPKSMSRDPRPPLDIIAYSYREEESFQSVLSIGLWTN
ncbi:hypothetical protein DPMN_191522 [Dreissena polymorpha]|uniref:Uncharacterized protein n=1 Tax=Dreissena polymorpha TaxID=45954 RepID=A0A9D3XZZ2_DREPO|nr:hypothetical protein DPMN_191522 [Dreissena polymorpha]